MRSFTADCALLGIRVKMKYVDAVPAASGLRGLVEGLPLRLRRVRTQKVGVTLLATNNVKLASSAYTLKQE